MRRLSLVLVPIAVAMAFATAEARPNSFPRPRFVQLLHGGDITVPVEWSGIWATIDSTHDCGSGDFSVDAYDDTLCAGTFNSDEGGFHLDCTGGLTSTSVNITCTGNFEVLPGCSVSVTWHMEGTVSGDDAHLEESSTQTYNPSECWFEPDQCQEIRSSLHRIAPQPIACTTLTRQSTWGGLKVLYR